MAKDGNLKSRSSQQAFLLLRKKDGTLKSPRVNRARVKEVL